VITQIRLGDDDRGLSSVVKPRTNVGFQGLAVAGTVREVADPSPGQDGSIDETKFADVAAVTLSLRVTGAFRGFLDELGQYCAPYARPYLEVSDDEWAGPRRLYIRFDSNNAPIVTGTGQTRVVALSWKVPAGCWQDASGVEYDIPGSQAVTGGVIVNDTALLSIDAVTGFTVHAANITADTLVNNTGSLKAPWKARLYGPCQGPALYRDDTAEGIVFTDSLSLNAGEYVELDSANRTANFLSNPDDGRLLYLDYVNSTDWFDIDPGQNLIRYSPDILTGTGAVAVVTFTPRRMPV
jgi:hypothetical protein